MPSQPTLFCVGMRAQESAFQQVRDSHCQGATFMAVPSPATYMRQLENS
jgi:hypothetical protein